MTADKPITAFQDALAFRLQRLRAAYGRKLGCRLDRREFSNLLNVSFVRYSSYERGDRMPPLEFMMEVRQITGVDLNKLLGPPDDMLDGL